MRLVWKLLRQHISIAQLLGFFIASLFGVTIILLSFQFYRDVLPLFSGKEGLIKNEYMIISKRVSTLGGIIKRSNTFTSREINEIKEQSFVAEVGQFTPSLFKVTAGVGLQGGFGPRFSTDMFFESVPDAFIDVNLDEWNADEAANGVIPIIIPRNYLNLYNFGFAQSQNLPQLSEGLIGRIKLDIRLKGDEKEQYFKGKIVGFSSRLNTILVPQSFLRDANAEFAPGQKAEPSRLIVEVSNASDPSLAEFLASNGYEKENENPDSGKMTHLLKVITGILVGVGTLICLLALYILILSIFLLLQKNTTKLTNLLLIGYLPRQVALPYQLITICLNACIIVLSFVAVWLIRPLYLNLFSEIFPAFEPTSILPMLIIGIAMAVVISVINLLIINRRINKLTLASDSH